MTKPAQQQLPDNALQQAFSQFSACSKELIATYQLLQEQVSRLNEELSLVRDARERELLENQRLTSRLDGLLQVLPAGVIVMDELSEIREANSTAHDLLGDGLVGLNWNKVLSWSVAEQVSASGEIKLNCGRWITIITTDLPTESRTLHLLVEVTKTRELQQKLIQHQRLSAMGEMVAELAHQIRTPLTAARLSVDCLKRQQLAESSTKPLYRIENQLLNLEQLVNDLLLFARRGEFAGQMIHTHTWLQHLSQLMNDRYGEALDLRINEESNFTILANEDLLNSALDNLIHNAMNVSAGRCRVQLSLASDSGQLVLRLTDNGPGIPEDIRERVFEPFFTTSSAGTGLGLSVARAIIEGHGGLIECMASDEGAFFELVLPLAEQPMLSGSRVS